MDARTAIKQIEQGRGAAAYLCYGTETYLLQQFVQGCIERLIEPEYREFGVSRFDLADTPLETVLDDAETLPFMVPRKVVIAHNALFFTGAKDSSKIEHRVDRLADYMKSPAEHTLLIFTVEADKLDERKKIVKTIKDAGGAIPFASLTADELSHWIARRAEKLRFSFGPGAAEQLALYTGANLQTLAGEMEKLSLFAGEQGVITLEMIDRLIARSTEQDVFRLIDEIVRMRAGQALDILSDLLKRKEEPIKIIMLMARQFRIILQVKEFEKTGYSHQQIASKIGGHPFVVKRAAEQGRGYDAKRLAALLSELAELDFAIKSGRADKVLGLELFILRLAAAV